MRFLGVAAVLTIAACDGSSVDGGSPADVRTAPGDHGEFALITDCRHGAELAVVGRGRRWFDDVPPESDGRDRALHRLTHEALAPRLARIGSIHSIAWGLACTSIGPSVVTDRWQDVDAIIGKVAGLLVDVDLREEVAISVAPRAEPL